jgi:nitrate/nitrite-specific signal transduction histidine kinase
MKRIKTKLWIGLGAIFFLSFLLLILNIIANQSISTKSESLLKDNYVSAKYTFEMLKIVDEMNNVILESNYFLTAPNTYYEISDKLKKLTESFQEKLELQKLNITETGEQKMTESLEHDYELYIKQTTQQNTEQYKSAYNSLRENILDLYNLNIQVLEQKNIDIQNKANKIMSVQKKIGILTLFIMTILVVLLPFVLINPIENLAMRLKAFYREKFNKEIKVEGNHELEVLENLFEKVMLEFDEWKKEHK